MLMDLIEARHSVRKYAGQEGFQFRTADAFCCAENMVLQATELGISSCIISRGEETFLSPEGQELLKEWEVDHEIYKERLVRD